MAFEFDLSYFLLGVVVGFLIYFMWKSKKRGK